MSKVEFTKEQQEAIDARDAKVLVSAAAGSGKTAVLTQRITEMIIPKNGSDPIDADKLLVVTFTRSAAYEIKQRVENSLKNEQKCAKLENDTKKIRYITKQIKKLQNAKMSTIDSFCVTLVREYFYLLDIDPLFSIAQAYDAKIIMDEVFEKVVFSLYEQKDPAFIRFVKNFCDNANENNLKKMLFSMHNFLESIVNQEEFLKKQASEYLCADSFVNTIWYEKLQNNFENILSSIIRAYDKALELVEDQQEYEDVNKLLKNERDFAICLKEEGITAIDKLNEFEFKTFTLPKGKKDNQTLKNLRQYAKSGFAKLDEFVQCQGSIIEKFLKEKMYPIIMDFVYIYQIFSNEVWETKKKRSMLTFSDIEQLCYKLLSQNENVRKEQQKRYKQILIDEYQDTNKLQDEIFKMLSGKDNIFMVGDIKQSIYRFRKSDPIVFKNKVESYREEKESKERKIILSSNFRSRQEVIDAVNSLFEKIMSSSVGDIDYDISQRLNCANKDYINNETNYKAECSVILNDTNTKSDIYAEAEYIAKRITELKNSKFLVADKGKEERIVNYSDIAILMSSHKSSIQIYKEVFDKFNIPFECEKEGFFKCEEIKIMMSLLKIIENPKQNIDMLSVMRSPIGNFSDDEISIVRIVYKKQSVYDALKIIKHKYEIENNNLDKKEKEFGEKVKTFLDKLNSWRDMARYMSADLMVATLFETTGIYNYYASKQKGDETANLRLFFDRADIYEKEGFCGVYKFSKHMQKLEKSSEDLKGANTMSGEDCVSIMTIHKSKGLEMPIVFLAGCGREFNLTTTNDRMLIHPELGFCMDYRSYEDKCEIKSPVHNIISSQIITEQKSEELRKLYVATTRAREKLIITAAMDSKKWQKMKTDDFQDEYEIGNCKSYIEWILPVATKSKDWEFSIYQTKEELQEDKKIKQIDERQAVPKEEIKEYEYFYELTAPKAKVSVSELKPHLFDEADMPKRPEFKNESNTDGATFGSGVHTIMETICIEKAQDKEYIKEHINYLSESGQLPKSVAQSININKIANFYNSSLGQRIKNAGKVYRESEFEVLAECSYIYKDKDYGDERILLQGIVDCWFEEDDGIVIVDFKTDNVSDEKEIHIRYDNQLSLYAYALEKITKKKVKDKFIYLFSSESVIQC